MNISVLRVEGFSLVEAAVATALMLIVIAGVFTLVDPARARSPVQLEAADMQQRLRVAADVLVEDLTMAGAGPYAGANAGPLTFWFAPVLPYRQGASGADPPGTYRSNTITLFYVPTTSAQTTLSAPLSAGQLTLQVNPDGCPVGQSLCGFAPGMTLLVFDSSGNFDTFMLAGTTGTSGQLTVNRPGGVLHTRYAAGSSVVQAIQRTYSVKTSSAQNFDQLVSYDGSTNTDVPIVDHLAGLEFEYYGDPRPPSLTRPVSDPAGPWTTYGPRPPAIDSKPTAYPYGENCVFAIDAATRLHVPRLVNLGRGPDPQSLVKLTAAELSDGDAWCPDVAAADRFDADLFRIRKIAVTLRIESAVDALRGPVGVLFRRGGTARDSNRLLPDHEVHFQIAPPNLNLRP
jgi:hypothetical protein